MTYPPCCDIQGGIFIWRWIKLLGQRKNVPDMFLTACSILYVLIPIIIFFFGWLRFYIAAPVSLLFIIFACSLYNELSGQISTIINKNSIKFWLIVLFCLSVWVLLSGIGGVFSQNSDFIARNSVYRDLCNYHWPVIYDMSTQDKIIQEFMGSDKIALSYYFSWWLFPAFITKFLSFGQTGQDICIYFWALIGVFLTMYNLCRYFNKNSFVILIVFIFFSGLDIIGYIIRILAHGGGGINILFKHLEWWSGSFQYSSNTTLLFWVFNQSIPSWVIISFFLQLRDSKNQLALASLTFAYSPWAAIGIFPIALTYVFIHTKNLRKILSIQNILVPLSLIVIYGTFYLASNGSKDKISGFMLKDVKHIAFYTLFIFLEFVIYFIVMGREAMKFDLYLIVLIELILIPCYGFISSGDFIMRSSIPALFILMTFLLRFLFEFKGRRKFLLIVLMIIGAITPMNEINRSVGKNTLYFLNSYEALPSSIVSIIPKNFEIRREEIYSLGKIRVNDTAINYMKNLLKNNYFVYDYENKSFFKYLVK